MRNTLIVMLAVLVSLPAQAGGPFFRGFDFSFDPPKELQELIIKGRSVFYRENPGNKLAEPSQMLRYSQVPKGKDPDLEYRDVTDPSRGQVSIWRGPTRFKTSLEQACFWFYGLEMMYHTLSVVYAARGDQRTATEFRWLSEQVAQTRGDRCKGQDGGAARIYLMDVVGGWRMTVESAGKADTYHRMLTTSSSTCIPVPMPGVVACAPQAGEVYVPSSAGETALLAAAVIAVLTPLPGDEAVAGAALARIPGWSWLLAHPEAVGP